MTGSQITHARQGRRQPARGAFTLIELMVVVAIIGLLVGILLPSFNNVRIQAKNLDTESFFKALEQGNEQFRAEPTIGGQYVPSHTDSEGSDRFNEFSWISNPLIPNPANPSDMLGPIAGASMLVYGLAGADTLGTAGFRDLDRVRDGFWYDDQGNNGRADVPYSYFLDPDRNLEPGQPRYGPYVDDKVRSDRIATFKQLMNEEGIIVSVTQPFGDLRHRAQKVFVDAFHQPILYYLSRRAATSMITDPTIGTPPAPGIFDHRDNQTLTGDTTGTYTGLDFGGGTAHEIARTLYPDVDPKVDNLKDQRFDETFERFTWDRNVTQRNTPVNRESFLLISAGRDGLYGTADDITNWNRQQ